MKIQDVQQTGSTDMEVDENVDVNMDEDSSSTSSKLPFILTGEFFKVTEDSTDQKVIAQCQNCPKTISGSRTSTGNFVSHYSVSFILIYFICSEERERKRGGGETVKPVCVFAKVYFVQSDADFISRLYRIKVDCEHRVSVHKSCSMYLLVRLLTD